MYNRLFPEAVAAMLGALLLFLLVLLLSMPSLLIMIVLMIIISAIMEWIKIMAERRSNKTSPKNTTESPTRR